MATAVPFHEAFAAELVRQDVDTVFGIVGDANLFLMDSFRRLPGTRYVAVAHEASAVAAAAGFAQVSGRLGWATVTHGPGLTNTVTALVEAAKADVPLVLIAGDTAAHDVHNLQNVDQRALMAATGAGFVQVRGVGTAAEDLATARRLAVLERRPVVLNVPADLQWAETGPLIGGSAPPQRQRVAPDEAALDAAVGVLAASRRPIVLAGRGVDSDDAVAAVVALAERLGAPLATTLKAKDLFRGHPADLGIFGTLSHPAASEAIAAADCVVALGAGLNPWTTAEGSLVRGKAVVHVDDDVRRLGRYVTPRVAVVGDVAMTARLFVSWLDDAEHPARAFAGDHVRPEPAPPAADGLVIEEALRLVDELAPADRTVVFDAGRFVLAAFPALRIPHRRGLVHTANFAAIGLGLPTAIGAAVAAPERCTVVICGDGGFALGGLTELATAVQQELDLLVVVLNDGAYGAEHVQMTDRGMDVAITTFAWPDLGPVAEAIGAHGATVGTATELRAALEDADRHGVALIDVLLDPHEIGWPGGHP